jgi:nicotinate-nucleotide pyrophosphorylase (carboxylating)
MVQSGKFGSEPLVPVIDWERAETLISLALEEDLGNCGDVTSLAVIPADLVANARIIAKETLVCAGLEVAERIFRRLDPGCAWKAQGCDGDEAMPGNAVAEIRGNAIQLLTAERTALNILQRLSGIATVSRTYAREVEGTATRILDTRKTTPGWRNLEKYAVAVGGATNHRIGLFDRVLIKDNHRELAGLEGKGGILRSVRKARAAWPKLEIEVEADTVEEAAEAVEAGADHVLLDNMTDAQMAEALRLRRNGVRFEASGGITLERVRRIAELGVDFISVGAITHSVRSVDLSMEIR